MKLLEWSGGESRCHSRHQSDDEVDEHGGGGGGRGAPGRMELNMMVAMMMIITHAHDDADGDDDVGMISEIGEGRTQLANCCHRGL